MPRGSIIITFLFATLPAFSQEIKQSERITATAEELAANENDPGAVDMFSDLLYELSENPVKINSGDENEISRLFFLTDFQVKVLADYIRTTGRVLSPFEIANIPGFDREVVEMLIPLITFQSNFKTFRDSLRFRQTILANHLIKTNVHDSSIVGSPCKNLIKYKFTSASLSGGFVAEKDPGEKFISGKPPLPDFLSGFLSFEGPNFVKHIIIGDYSVRFGQGTGINTGMNTGLSLTTPGFLSGRNEIKPYTSVDENNFLRGIAAELSLKNFELSLFYSKNKIDATLNETSDSLGRSIKAFYKTGLHNTGGSVSKKDVVNETNLGINLSYNFRNARAGVIWTETGFSLPVNPMLTDPADKYDFRGQKNSLYTIYYNALFKRFIFFGEFSNSGSRKNAFVQGVSIRPADRMNLNFLYSSCSRDFVSFHGSGPAGGAAAGNGYGMFGNFTIEAARYLFISGGCEMKYFSWLRYRCSSPSMAKRTELRIRYIPSGKLTFEALYNFRLQVIDNNVENKIPGQNEIITRSIRGSMKYSPTDYFTIILRADYKTVNHPESSGVSLLQDINLRMKTLPVSIWMRYCIFNTGGFESCIYTWENDLQNGFSVPGLYGIGSRVYIMASCKIADRVQLRLKYGITSTSVLNSRMNEIHELKLQLKIMI
jgi:hypothetical protein